MALRFIDILVNCPDRETAAAIADACIEGRLAACANILSPVESRYRWKGAVETEAEIPLLLKTRESLFDAVCAIVRGLHPYEVPSITATQISNIDQAYAAWLREETEGNQ